MSAKHTSGPWFWTSRVGGWDGVDAGSGEKICALEYNNPENARLIAAAPDLLKACQMMIPKNVCLTNANIRDSEVLTLDVRLGDLRTIADIVAKATQS